MVERRVWVGRVRVDRRQVKGGGWRVGVMGLGRVRGSEMR